MWVWSGSPPTRTPTSRSAAYGTVFVKYQQEWSTICGAGFSTDDAKVICRSLGYGSGWVVPFSLSYFGVGTGPVHVHKMECRGYEDWIRECPSFVWSQSLCVHHLDVGVFCYDGGLELRLAGGSNPDTGVVEAKMGNVWGSFCDADFDDFDAQVVCRQLGYVDGISTSGLAARPTPGPMWHIRLDCLGQEHTLQECRIRFLNGTCSRSSAASVRCFNTAGFVDDALKALLPADCGVLEEASDQFIIRLAKIRGGSHPTRFNSPWLASLRSQKGHLECGAFIISEDYLITAAHCFNRGGVLNFKVRVGDHNENFREEFEEEFDIEKIWIHENLNAYTFLDNDIALIKIKREYGRGITFGPRVKPVCLPSSSDSYEDLGDCIIMGWGRVEEEGQTQPRPNEVEIGIIPDDVCESRFLGGAHNYSSSSVCFGGIRTKGEACNGDSGGPLTCSTSGRHTAYGVFSRGLVCGKVPAPSVGVRMTKFLRWILEKIRN
ncbi:neurotrypsin-like [Panulirus ornatus]|uniref:neurotrypsin-like n=1 Tax=Panulirus ornatus TaxID=150431 RepID=UPI003A84289A